MMKSFQILKDMGSHEAKLQTVCFSSNHLIEQLSWHKHSYLSLEEENIHPYDLSLFRQVLEARLQAKLYMGQISPFSCYTKKLVCSKLVCLMKNLVPQNCKVFKLVSVGETENIVRSTSL